MDRANQKPFVLEDPATQAEQRAELDAITTDLLDKLHDKRSRWSELYLLIDKVESAALWQAGGFSSMTKWLEDLARRAGCQIQYLWRVKKAGKFYKAYADAEQAAGRQVAPVDEVQLGDEMLANIDRISGGKPDRAREYIAAALDGTLTKAKVKQMVKATAGARRAAKVKTEAADASTDGGGVDGATAADVILALDNPALFYTEGERSAHLLRGARRSFALLAEFPVQTGTADRARRMDALVIGNRGGTDQYECTLDMVEIKVTESDLRNDTKHLEYEPFADRCWFAVPAGLADAAAEVAPTGWGVIIYDAATGTASVSQPAELRPGVMRATTLATVALRLAPQMAQRWQGR